MINPKELPAAWKKGLVAAVLVGMGTLYFGRDSLYFQNGSGGERWKIGSAQIHAFNAHQARSPEHIHAKALALVNRDRAVNGLPPLALDARLAQLAQQQAKDMAQRGYFSSRSPEGREARDRFRAARIQASDVGENLLFGEGWGDQLAYRQVELLERQGMYSRVHRENLLGAQYTHVGFGFVADVKTKDIYAVQVFRGDLPGMASSTAAAPKGALAKQVPPVTKPPDPFRDAVNAATRAAHLTQTARSPQQWGEVATHWHRAIAQMKAVPSGHPRRALAQQKAQEYANNLAYAEQNAQASSQQSSNQLSKQSKVPSPQPAKAALSPAAKPPLAPFKLPKQFSTPERSKLLLILLGGTALAWVLSSDSLALFQSKDQEMPPPPKKIKQSLPWKLIFSNMVHDLWDMQPFFKTERVYKMTAATSAHKLQRKLNRRLRSLTGDQATAMQLIKENLRRHPGQSVDWCCQQAIKDLEKQRQRESRMQHEG